MPEPFLIILLIVILVIEIVWIARSQQDNDSW